MAFKTPFINQEKQPSPLYFMRKLLELLKTTRKTGYELSSSLQSNVWVITSVDRQVESKMFRRQFRSTSPFSVPSFTKNENHRNSFHRIHKSTCLLTRSYSTQEDNQKQQQNPQPPSNRGRLSRFYERMLSPVTDSDLRRFLAQALSFTTQGVVLVSVLGTLGVDTKPLLTGFGAIGVSLGFALKEVTGDAFCGIYLLLNKPFKNGDEIEIQNGKIRGTVRAVDVRYVSLEVKSSDNNESRTELLLVPSSVIFNSAIRLINKA